MNSDPELPSIAEMSRIRADVYAFLSEAFLEEPDEVTLDRLAERAEADELEFVPEAVRDETSNADAFDGTNLLQEVGHEVRDLDATGREDFLEDLAAEYASLFLTAGAKQVNPYQSFYLGDEGILYQEETLKLKEIMQELGYEGAEENAEPEDHLGNELAFVAYLCRSAARSQEHGEIEYARRYLNLQKQFLEQHLLEWVPDCCADIQENTDSAYFEGIARLTVDFLEQEPAMISYMMDALPDEDE
jgi:TorA maturation chaperone TorD